MWQQNDKTAMYVAVCILCMIVHCVQCILLSLDIKIAIKKCIYLKLTVLWSRSNVRLLGLALKMTLKTVCQSRN